MTILRGKVKSRRTAITRDPLDPLGHQGIGVQEADPVDRPGRDLLLAQGSDAKLEKGDPRLHDPPHGTGMAQGITFIAVSQIGVGI